jgi:hypothetical protein
MRRGALILILLALGPATVRAQPDDRDNIVDARIRASAAAAQSLQGPLDGAWTLVGPSGQAIYAFQIVDKPGGADSLEGVWRDLRRPSVPGDIGMIDALGRGPGTLTLSFSVKPGDPPVIVELRNGPDGGWAGRLREAGGTVQVSLRRN